MNNQTPINDKILTITNSASLKSNQYKMKNVNPTHQNFSADVKEKEDYKSQKHKKIY